MNLKEALRSRVPNIRFMRVMLSKYRVNEINAMLLPGDEVRRCEADPDRKRGVVAQRTASPSKDIAMVGKIADQILGESGLYDARSDLAAIREDMLFCRLAYGFKPNEYVAFELEQKDMEKRLEYVSDLVRQRYHCRMNDLADASRFKDKYRTYLAFREYYGREAIAISAPSDFEAFRAYVARHPEFVKKEAFESLGRSVELVNMQTCGKSEQALFNALIARGKHILEEKIDQSPALSAFNSSSVNTVRSITFRTRGGIVVPYCILRMGRNGKFVDNGGAGGIIACVDFDTGRIITDAHDEQGGVYPKHPDSGMVIKGQQLPDWDGLKALCHAAAGVIPSVQYVGWDMAHTPKGWVIVEGNAGSQMIGQQVILGGLHQRMEQIASDMELLY